MTKNHNLIIIFIILIISLVALPFSITAVSAESERESVTFSYSGQTFKYVDNIIKPTDHLVAETIHKRKINGSLSEKLMLVDRCIAAGLDWKEAMLHTFPLLYKTVDKVIKAVNCDPVNSTISFNPNKKPMFSITREKNGYEIAESKLYQEVYIAFRRSSKNARIIAVTPKVITPDVTSFDNVKLTHLRSRFSTSYASSNENRKHNIRLALSKINGYMLKSGEEFSFNKVVGQRSEKRGFKTAKIILEGEYVDGVGGGVCQASTTVYNAAIRADLTITRVFNHSLPSSYVPPSFDAMVNANTADLRFKNSGETPVFIKCTADENDCTVEIYGTQLGYKIDTESVVVMRCEPPPDEEFIDLDRNYVSVNSPPGRRLRVLNGHGAIKSEGYLVYYDRFGNVFERKLIRKDSYKSKRGLVAIAPDSSEGDCLFDADIKSVNAGILPIEFDQAI